MTNNKRRIKCLILILTVLVSSLMLGLISNNTGKKTNIINDINENKEKQLDLIDDILDNLKSSQSGEWWNSSYRYRTEIKLEEPGFFNRTNEPVDVYLTFAQDSCHKDTLRVLERNIDEIPNQVWNISYYDATYIESATITFLANVNKSETVSYYIYYSDTNDDDKIQNPKQKYISQSGFSSTLNEIEGRLSIKTTEFSLELQEGMGVYNFSKGGINYHTNESLAPWIKPAKVDTEIYHPDPDEGGAIYNWLVLGKFGDYVFDYFNPNWNNPVTATQHHIDITKQYVEGDYATGGDAIGFLDETQQWNSWDAMTETGTYTSTNGYMDLNWYFSGSNSGNPEYKAIYASCYIRSPVDLNNVYLKVGSDDGIKVIRDGQVIHYNHVLRSPRPDREAVGPLDFEAGRWYYFIVLIEENTGQTGFHFRFSTNPTLYGTSPENDPGAINNLDIALRPPLPLIESITEVSNDEVGPIFARYDVSWEDDGDMRTSDTITVYNDYNLWKSERNFWWTTEQRDANFSMIATIYEDNNNYFDRYFYDYNIQSVGLGNNDFTPENYTILWDDDSGTNFNSLGIFISNIKEGGTATLDELYWAVDYEATTDVINLRPGNQTNLNNGAGGSSNYIEITFWEYLDDNVGVGGSDEANETFSGIYNSLINPLIQTKEPVEASFFDLTVNVTDRDGYVVEGVKVYAYNATTKEYLANQTTDENGLTTFTRLPRNNYTLNATFQKYGKPAFPVKGDVNVSLDTSKTVKLEHLNLTSLNLDLRQRDSPWDPVKGADVTFYYRNLAGDRSEIGTEISDDNGKVSFVWENTSQLVANISFKVVILGTQYTLNNSESIGAQYLNYTFESRTEDIIGVAVGSYDSEIQIISPTDIPIENIYKSEKVNITVRYNFTVSGGPTNQPIDDALVTFNILNPSLQSIGTGQFNDDVLPIGVYNVSIDTNAFDIIAGGVTYFIEITARKQGYTPQKETIPIQLLEIWTNLMASESSKNIIVPWNGNITIRVHYNDTLFGRDIGLADATVSYNIPGRISGGFTKDFNNGTYELVLNSSKIGKIGDYVVALTAVKINYIFQEIFINLTVTAINSQLISNISGNRLTVIWNEVFSIELKYNDTDNDVLIPGADISFTSLTRFGTVEDDFIDNGDGTYTLTYNTTHFTDASSYSLTIKATGLNIYAEQTLEIRLEILPVPTLLNGKISIINTYDIYVGTGAPFIFYYNKTSGIGIRDALATYQWQKGSGDFTTGLLNNGSVDGQYILDFNLKLKQIGRYSLIISFAYPNHESRIATLIINIINREIDADVDAKGLKDDQINVVKGNDVKIEVELIDELTGLHIRDADVVLEIGDDEFDFDEDDPGIYTYTFSTEEYEAFFTSQTLTGEIKIKAANYTSETIDITIVIEMEEIIDGVPTFYFIMITGAITAIVGSLATYRYIQIARIPKFVKKARKVKKAIKSKAEISESLLYPSKDEFMVKTLEETYDAIGLSMADLLGIKGKKGKTLSEKTDSIKKEGGDI